VYSSNSNILAIHYSTVIVKLACSRISRETVGSVPVSLGRIRRPDGFVSGVDAILLFSTNTQFEKDTNNPSNSTPSTLSLSRQTLACALCKFDFIFPLPFPNENYEPIYSTVKSTVHKSHIQIVQIAKGALPPHAAAKSKRAHPLAGTSKKPKTNKKEASLPLWARTATPVSKPTVFEIGRFRFRNQERDMTRLTCFQI
jgi:hypothetical protein